MNELLNKYNIVLTGIWNEWNSSGLIESCKMKNSPFIVIYNKEWDFDSNKEYTKIDWQNYGLVIIRNLGRTDPNILEQDALKDALEKEINEINNYSNCELEWSPHRRLKINQMDALSSHTRGHITINNKYKLDGRITVYIIYSSNHLVSLRISGAYSAKSPWGNREPILRECILDYTKVPRKKSELNKKSNLRQYSTSSVPYTILSISEKIKRLEQKIDEFNNNIKQIDFKLSNLINDLEKKYSDTDEGFLQINQRISELKSYIMMFFENAISKLRVREYKDEIY
ncbi:MAG: hypothetical protein ACTSQO_04575 [Candidatus Helarchaeota archaeon]